MMEFPIFNRRFHTSRFWAVLNEPHPEDPSVFVVSIRWFDSVENLCRYTVVGYANDVAEANGACTRIANRMALNGGFPVVREDNVTLTIDPESFGLNGFSNNPHLTGGEA